MPRHTSVTCVYVLIVMSLGIVSPDWPSQRHLSDPDAIGVARLSLDGTWVVATAFWCGKELPFTEKEKAEMQWTFLEGRFKYGKCTDDSALEEGTYQIDFSKSPKLLDLKYAKGDLLAVRKCIFEINRDEVKLAHSIPYLPGTPEKEIEEAKKMFAKRPKSFDFDPDSDDSTLILVLKRTK